MPVAMRIGTIAALCAGLRLSPRAGVASTPPERPEPHRVVARDLDGRRPRLARRAAHGGRPRPSAVSELRRARRGAD